MGHNTGWVGATYFIIPTAILKQTPANPRHNAASNFSPVDTRTRTSRRDAIVRCVVIATPRINSSVVIINKTAAVVSFMVIGSTLFRVSVLHRPSNGAYACNETRCFTHAHAVDFRHRSGNITGHHVLG